MIGAFFSRGLDPNNREVGRLLWFLTALAGIGYTGADLVVNNRFSIEAFGQGMAFILAGGGIGIGSKDYANRAQPNTTTVTKVEQP